MTKETHTHQGKSQPQFSDTSTYKYSSSTAVTQKTKEPKTAAKQQELEEGSGREIEENAEKLLQDLYIHSTNPVLVSYLGHLATPRDLSQLDAIIRVRRNVDWYLEAVFSLFFSSFI